MCQNTEAKVKQKPVYIFGFATSFADSLGYITDVQYIDSSYVDVKTKFLMGRSMYSLQFQQYLEANEGCKHPVTAIFFGEKKDKVEKKLLSLRRKYEKEGDLILKTVACTFHAERYEEQEITDSPGSGGVSRKAAKKNKKSKNK
ncbi:MAG: hypothetical protein J6W52_00325 [Bacteroidaceae bacterium]|nr:hypothetical protein [Bacteroidaceae bacterium]